MKKHIFVAGAAVLALGFSVSIASAVCDIEHPKKAGSLSSSLVQAFVSCGNLGGNPPDTTTEGGVPACSPETFHQQAGTPGGGWLWDEGKGQGKVTFKASKNKVVNILNPANTGDLAVALSLGGVITQGTLAPANGSGTLATVARATFEDRVGGGTMVTVVDFPADFPFTITGGKAKLKTSANALLNGIGQPGLPGCATIEVVSVNVLDTNGNAFASLGTFLPDLPQ